MAESTVEIESNPGSAAPAGLTPRRVLLVDADEGGRDMTRGLLKLALQNRVDVEETTNVRDAIERLRESKPDCLLLDADLPGMPVPEALAMLSSTFGEMPCPVVVLNGSDEAARASIVIGGGAHDRVAKQWLSPPFLRRVLENVIERFRMEQRARRQADDLDTTSRQLRLASNATRMGHWSFNLATSAGHADQTCADLCDRTIEELAAPNGGLEHVHPDDRPKVQDAFRRAIDDGRYECEFRSVHRDGSIHWLAGLGDVLRDETGAVIGFTGVTWDITHRKESEIKLQESERRYRSLVSIITDIPWTTDPLGGFAQPQEAWSAYTGQTWEQQKGFGWSEAIHPDDREPIEVRWAESLENQSLYETGGRLWHAASSTYRQFIVRATPLLDEAGKVVEWVGAITDVEDRHAIEHALRRSEASMRSIASHSPDVIARFDRQTRHLYVNDAATTVTGLPVEALIGRSPRELWMPPRLCDEWEAKVAAAFESGQTQTCEFAFNTPTGERFYQSILVPERNVDGSIETVLGITRDVSADRSASRQLRSAAEEAGRAQQIAEDGQKEAERASKAKDHFLAVLSHELRTPLTPVLAAASELAQRTDLPDDVREDLAMIQRNVELEGRLMDDMLDLTRVSRGKLELNFTLVDAHESARRVLEMVAADARSKQITLNVDLSADHSTVLADSARLQQMLWNLLKNAVKFTPPGGRIRLSSEFEAGCDDVQSPHQPTEGCLRFTLIDSGTGIDAELLPRVFDAFEQGGPETTRQFGGLGLGLAITKVLVDLHGGTIRAESTGRNHGSTFTLELPTASVDNTVEPQQTPVAVASQLRVLLVEDHPDTSRITSRLLRSRGMTVQLADSVATALRLTSADAFDVIISDLGLPDGSGHDLLRQIRVGGNNTPAIVVSGFGSDEDRRDSRSAGFAAHLTKPLNFDKLLEAINNATEN